MAPVCRAAAEPCFTALAATRSYSLGRPEHVVVAPDGQSVFYLRSGPRDTKLGLFQYMRDVHHERALAKPDQGPEHLSVEETARRERARMTLTGITDFALSEDGKRILLSQADQLSTLDLPEGVIKPVPGRGWIAPRLSPDGTRIAAVRDNDVHVVNIATGQDTQITHGGTDIITHGLPDFAAAEELDRLDGTWWSPDGTHLVIEQADSTGVEKHFIADPEHPSAQPVEFRYPRAGTANADVKLAVVPADGGAPVWLDWDRAQFPYVARVMWPKHGPLTVVLLNRLQMSEVAFKVDPATGKLARLVGETDEAWINLEPDHGLAGAGAKKLPYWLADGSGFLWASERSGTWQLELRHADGTLDHAITPAGLPFVALNDVDTAAGSLVVTARPDRMSTAAYRVKLAGGNPTRLTQTDGLHEIVAGEDQHDVLVDTFSGADNGAGVAIIGADGTRQALLPSYAELPRPPPMCNSPPPARATWMR